MADATESALNKLSLDKKEGETPGSPAGEAPAAAAGPFGASKPAFTFGGSAAAGTNPSGGFSFGSVAAANPAGAGFAFGGAGGAASFAPPPPPPTGAEEEDANPEAFEPKQYKAALAEMPEEVEVKTMEETEEVMYVHRAKLYRFDRDSEQWKERGLGDIKVLKSKENGKVRLLMRQEKTLKICANHLLTPDIQFKPNAGSDKSFVWTCQDFADLELKDEILAVRFKTPEIAKDFLEKAQQGQADFQKLLDAEKKDGDDAAEEDKKEEESKPEAEAEAEEEKKAEE